MENKADCGSSRPESSGNSNRLGSSLRMSLGCWIRTATGFSLKWKKRATASGRPWWELTLSGPPTCGGAPGYFAREQTPVATVRHLREWELFLKRLRARWRAQSPDGKAAPPTWPRELARLRAMPIPMPKSRAIAMGYPADFTNAAGAETSQGDGDFVRIARDFDGLSDWLAWHHALGNSVVPEIPMLFGVFMKQIHDAGRPGEGEAR